jgi:hypothetical protein
MDSDSDPSKDLVLGRSSLRRAEVNNYESIVWPTEVAAVAVSDHPGC